ncbi:S24/S26 family peptidase [Fibrobacterota bacterium]
MDKHQKQILLTALDKFGTVEVRVGGWSMWPFIRHNETIVVAKEMKTPYLGKVIAFFNENQLIAHRVAWSRPKGNGSADFWVLGDFSQFSLSRIDSRQVIGTVSGLKVDGFRNLWLIQPFCVFALIIGFILRGILSINKLVKWIFRPIS